MPRPRRLNADTMQGFNCSYGLKVGMIRAAEIERKESPSSLIREVMENFCQERLVAAEWNELKKSESKEYRHDRLGEAVDRNWFKDLKKQLSRGSRANPKERRARLAVDLEAYARQLERERDDRNYNLGVRIALQEAVDLVQQLRHLCRKEKVPAAQLGLLIERFPTFWKPTVAEIVQEFV